MSEGEQLEPVGATIGGRYRVEALLGRGGTAAVYRVRDDKTQKQLALKRSYADRPTLLQKRRALLEREYHTLAQLAHPLIIEVYDFGVDERGPFYTMELLDGSDLHDGGRLPWKEACAVLRDVASALAMLHARGLLHRDVSTRNVRRTSSGAAKLIDFGSMASMGVSANVSGTPPFLAPEAMQMQSLDGRADLFALGALGYFLLTGRHAFPARRLSELRDVWRSPPVPAARVLPEVPQALSTLISRLLTLDRGARPQAAAEVIASVCAIGGLKCDDQPAVWSSYLTTPRLVGRDDALMLIRQHMLSSVRGDGGTILVEGDSGTGRSRLLDACALEAKLVGATVIRAAATDAASSVDFGVARSLLTGMLEQLPSEVAEAARLARESVLGGFLESIAAASASPAVDRSLLIRELRELVFAVSRKRRLLLVVDDVDRLDEASAAVLGALAQKAEHYPLILAVAAESGRGQMLSGALRLLHSSAEVIALDDLDAEHSEALLRSVFGDVANLSFVAAGIYAVAHGNPRVTLELAQHLLTRGLARYTAGGWTLPARLDEHDLPLTLASSLAARLQLLGPDALELAAVLALGVSDQLTVSDYAALTHHGDGQRVFNALDELLACRVLTARADTNQFTQRGFLSLLPQLIAADEREQIHARLAELLSARGGPMLLRVHHLLAAGREVEGVELLCSTMVDPSTAELALLERALQSAERRRMPARLVQQLRIAVVSKAPFVLALDSFRRTWPSTMARLERESGLALVGELTDVPAEERLARAVELAQLRYSQTPEHDRAHDVLTALEQLGTLTARATLFGVAAIDLEFLERLPDLYALRALSPAFEILSKFSDAAKHWVAGRYYHSRAIYERMLEQLARPDRGELSEAQHGRSYRAAHFMIAQLDASAGIDIEDRAAILEREPSMRASAWQIRQLFNLSQGNLVDARKCMRRSELLRLQTEHPHHLIGMTTTLELLAACNTLDLQGVRNALEAMAVLADASAGWKPLLVYGQGRYRELQGDLPGALENLLAGLELAAPGRHLAWGMLAAAHVSLLTQLGMTEQAIAHGLRYVEVSDALELHSGPEGIHTALARALSAAGRHVEAMRAVDRQIDRGAGRRETGIGMGALFELRARIALDVNDPVSFQHFAERCADEYSNARSSALATRFARLMEDASAQHVELRRSIPPVLGSFSMHSDEDEYETVHSRMRECADHEERARCALTLLLQDIECFTGYLFEIEPSEPERFALQLIASVPEAPPQQALVGWATDWISAELAVRAETAITCDALDDRTVTPELTPRRMSFEDEHGRDFVAVVLAVRGQPQAAAHLFVFERGAGPHRDPSRRLLNELAAELHDTTAIP